MATLKTYILNRNPFRHYPVFSLVIIFFIVTSCQDVINLNLKDSAPQIVIEGSISNRPDSVKVIISKSTDYFTPGNITPVTNAQVNLSDDGGNSFSLNQIKPGTYSLTDLSGIPGRTYILKVNADGKEYIAKSTMPLVVRLDSLSINYHTDRRNENALFLYFNDPDNIANYYGIKVYQNDSLIDSGRRIVLSTDKYYNGRGTTLSVDSRRLGVSVFKPLSNLRVQLLGIDKSTYQYFRTLRDITGQSGIMSASTPANPPNNWSNGALGYFAAWSISERSIRVGAEVNP